MSVPGNASSITRSRESPEPSTVTIGCAGGTVKRAVSCPDPAWGGVVCVMGGLWGLLISLAAVLLSRLPGYDGPLTRLPDFADRAAGRGLSRQRAGRRASGASARRRAEPQGRYRPARGSRGGAVGEDALQKGVPRAPFGAGLVPPVGDLGQPGAEREPPNSWTDSAAVSPAKASRSVSGHPARLPVTKPATNTSPAPVVSSASTGMRRHVGGLPGTRVHGVGAVRSHGHDGQRHLLGECGAAERGVSVRCSASPRWRWAGTPRSAAGRQRRRVPAAGLVPADIGEDRGCPAARRARATPGRARYREETQARARGRALGASGSFGRRGGGLVAVEIIVRSPS